MEAQSSELIYQEGSLESPIRLLLDGRKLGDGGIGVYTENLITGLLAVGGVEITVLHRGGARLDAPYASSVSWMRDDARPYSLNELFFMPGRIDFSRFDLFHTPHYMLPYRIPIPTIVTVHDLIHMTHPEKFFYPLVARKLIASAVRRASGVLAVSRHTRDGVLKLTGAAQGKVRFAPNAVSDRVLTRGAAHEQRTAQQPYLFALFSNNKPHKGLNDLLAAYKEFRRAQTSEPSTTRCPALVIGGFGIEPLLLSRDWRALVDSIEGVIVTGALSDSQVRSHMEQATALIVPSLAEGFCLPALEAQACGTPVICRPIPALREFVTERDTVAKDFSVAALIEAISEGVRRASSEPRAVIQGHLESFSCKSVAVIVKAEYERVMQAGVRR